MGKYTYIGGDYLENIGGNKIVHVVGDNDVHSNKQIIQKADGGIFYEEPKDAPEKKVEEDIKYINGHFYNEDGTYEGKVDETTNTGVIDDVYTCTGKGKAKDKKGKEIDIYKGIRLLKLFENNLSHSNLLIYGGIVHGEATNQNSTDVGITLEQLKIERYCFANAIHNFMKSTSKEKISELSASFSYAKKDETPPYKLVVNSTPEERNNVWIKTAIYAVINAVRETKDYSNGATHWDGPDVMTGNLVMYQMCW